VYSNDWHVFRACLVKTIRCCRMCQRTGVLSTVSVRVLVVELSSNSTCNGQPNSRFVQLAGFHVVIAIQSRDFESWNPGRLPIPNPRVPMPGFRDYKMFVIIVLVRVLDDK